jgi:FlaA1/EpsC-like NDP-sugar epimerase
MKDFIDIWNNSRVGALLRRFLPYRHPFIIIFHLGLMAVAYLGAYYLRFEGLIPEEHYRTMWLTLPIFLVVQGLFFYYHDLYEGLWRYVSVTDLQNILRSIILSILVLIPMEFLFSRYTGVIPRSVYVLDGILLVALTAGCRIAVRIFREHHKLSDIRTRVMLVGSVEAVEPLLREMCSHNSMYFPVLVVDPQPHYRGHRLYDVPIIGGLHQMARLVARHNIKEIIFAWPDAPPDQLKDIVEECKRCQVRYKVIPSLGEVLDGQYRLPDVRDIELEDLLPRPPVYIDQEDISSFIRDKVILVTGGGGSIGSELCRQVAKFKPRTLVIFERAENVLYEIEVYLRRRFPQLHLEALVASINDAQGLRLLLQQYRPEVIFHAAAYKHVPLMERCPVEAAYNNILGTRNLARAALEAKVGRFIMISTDKAVNPTSIMGVSKRITEKYVQSCNDPQSTRFITTRFGNVLGSAGSVIPILKEQLAQGGPLTVTHPEIERFFMTIPESVQLVLQAAHMGKGGDIFILNMGCSVKIRDLAEKLILLAGKTPWKDVDIKYVGLRPGEKLYEELFNVDENPQPTEHPLINRALGPDEDCSVWETHLDDIQVLVSRRDTDALIAKFRAIIPNFTPESNSQS